MNSSNYTISTNVEFWPMTRARKFIDLLRSFLAIVKKNNPNDIRSREFYMTHTFNQWRVISCWAIFPLTT